MQWARELPDDKIIMVAAYLRAEGDLSEAFLNGHFLSVRTHQEYLGPPHLWTLIDSHSALLNEMNHFQGDPFVLSELCNTSKYH